MYAAFTYVSTVRSIGCSENHLPTALHECPGFGNQSYAKDSLTPFEAKKISGANTAVKPATSVNEIPPLCLLLDHDVSWRFLAADSSSFVSDGLSGSDTVGHGEIEDVLLVEVLMKRDFHHDFRVFRAVFV